MLAGLRATVLQWEALAAAGAKPDMPPEVHDLEDFGSAQFVLADRFVVPFIVTTVIDSFMSSVIDSVICFPPMSGIALLDPGPEPVSCSVRIVRGAGLVLASASSHLPRDSGRRPTRAPRRSSIARPNTARR